MFISHGWIEEWSRHRKVIFTLRSAQHQSFFPCSVPVGPRRAYGLERPELDKPPISDKVCHFEFVCRPQNWLRFHWSLRVGTLSLRRLISIYSNTKEMAYAFCSSDIAPSQVCESLSLAFAYSLRSQGRCLGMTWDWERRFKPSRFLWPCFAKQTLLSTLALIGSARGIPCQRANYISRNSKARFVRFLWCQSSVQSNEPPKTFPLIFETVINQAQFQECVYPDTCLLRNWNIIFSFSGIGQPKKRKLLYQVFNYKFKDFCYLFQDWAIILNKNKVFYFFHLFPS